MTDAIKPCPFCGGEAEIERFGNTRVSTIYRCNECGCQLETSEEFNHGRSWNRRAETLETPALGMKASSGRNEVLNPPINDCGEGEPVGYFQHNAAWNAWEQVAQEFDGQEGVTALYAAPSSKGKTDGEALQDELRDMLLADCKAMRAAGQTLSEAAVQVIRDYDGLHRLSAAVAAWCQVIANEGGRGERHAPPSNPAQALPDGEVLPTGEMLAAGRDALEPYVGALKQPVSDQWQLARDVWSAMSKPSSRNGDK